MVAQLSVVNASSNTDDVIVVCWPGGHEEPLARGGIQHIRARETEDQSVGAFWFETRPAPEGTGTTKRDLAVLVS